jgi:hypothetical protein
VSPDQILDRVMRAVPVPAVPMRERRGNDAEWQPSRY